MDELLFLAHRIPYPPNKGDKIRSYHMLQHLAARYRVHLGCFIDDPADWTHVGGLERLCVDTCFVRLSPFAAKLRSLRGLLTGEPLTLPYYRSARLKAWVDERIASGAVGRAVAFSAAMAQYLDGVPTGVRRVLDFVDMDSDKWRQYASTRRWPLSVVYRRESARLLDYERRVASEFDASLFVSESEARLFLDRAPETAERVGHFENGVDLEYFSPGRSYPNPYDAHEQPVVFTGAMDYWANIDAVTWFARDVLPRIRARVQAARFYIVGARPAPAVRALAREGGVVVTGAVEDVRPYLAHARVAVAPLRIARGVQNKVLEAMAMGVPVVASTQAIEGIRLCAGLEELIVDGADAMARRATELLTAGAGERLRALERACVVEHYRWERSLDRFARVVEGEFRREVSPVPSASVAGMQ